MFENLYFDIRTFNRNKQLAKILGIDYTPATHKAYKQNLRAMHKPVKSVAKVILDDVYDDGLVGFSYSSLNVRKQGAGESDLRYWHYVRGVTKQLIQDGEETEKFVRLKTKVGCYTEAFRLATEAKIETKISLDGSIKEAMRENNKEISELCTIHPNLTMKLGDQFYNPSWDMPKGYGWFGLHCAI